MPQSLHHSSSSQLRTQVGATGRDVGPILLAPFLPLTPEESDRPCDVTFRKGPPRCSPSHSVSSTRESDVHTVAFMVCDFDKSVAVAGPLDQRYTVRYSFAVTAEILELETGSRLRGVTSDLSLRGCFRPYVECNSTFVDRESEKVWLKHPHQAPKWPEHTTYRQ